MVIRALVVPKQLTFVVVISNLQPSVMTLGISEWHCAARRNGRFSQIGPEGWIGRF